MLYVVLGMHKSGTSLVAEILHRAGIDMLGAHATIETPEKRPKYEHAGMRQLNKDILGCSETFSLDIAVPAVLRLTPSQRKRLHDLLGDGERRFADWGFKDPRTCLTYPVLQTHLPRHRLVLVYRHPEQVRRHYCAKNAWRIGRALQAWTRYNQSIRDILLDTPCDAILLSYERLMQAPLELQRLERFIGRTVVDVRRPVWFRHRQTHGWPTRVADRVLRWWQMGPLALYAELETLRARQVATPAWET